MSLELWFGLAVVTWATVGFGIWLCYCWYEGSSEPNGDGILSPSFVAQAWPLVLVLLLAMGALVAVFGPFVWIHQKISEEVARRGRERKESGIANSGPGKVVEEFGVRKD